MEFKTEAAADTHYKKLDKTKVRGNKLVVDYVGTKSILRPTSESDKTPKPGKYSECFELKNGSKLVN